MRKQPAARPFPLHGKDFFIKTNRSPNKTSLDCNKPPLSRAAYFHMYLCRVYFQNHSFTVLQTIELRAAVSSAEAAVLIGNVLWIKKWAACTSRVTGLKEGHIVTEFWGLGL